MRHRVAGKQLSRNSSHRRALRRNMAASLFQHGTIRTTEAKAKQLRSFVEKLITLARKNTLHARRLVISRLRDRLIADDKGEIQEKTIVQKLFDEIAPRYVDWPGGYTRIIRIAERRIGDAGKQVLLQLVEERKGGSEGGSKTSRRRRRATKRYEAVKAGAAAQPGETAEPAPKAEEPKADEAK